VRLGLALNLNPLANGGFERSTDTGIQEPSPMSPAVDTADDDPCIPSGFGRILHDDTGNIIGFECSKPEERPSSEVGDMAGLQLEADADQAMHRRWAATLSLNGAAGIDPKGKCVLRGESIECCVDFSLWYLISANVTTLQQ
jgi:nucleolar protein 16